MRIFVMMVGIPGSGKTWLCRKAFYDATVICPDDKIGYTKDNPWTPQAAKMAWKASDGKFASLINDDTTELVVFDATNTTANHRRKYMKRAADAGFQTIAVLCDTTEATCLERNSIRDKNRQVPLNTIRRMFGKLESPTLNEGIHMAVKIDAVNGIHSFYASEDCICGDEIRERFKFLWSDAQHKSLTVVKR
jgi:predicted kinase